MKKIITNLILFLSMFLITDVAFMRDNPNNFELNVPILKFLAQINYNYPVGKVSLEKNNNLILFA